MIQDFWQASYDVQFWLFLVTIDAQYNNNIKSCNIITSTDELLRKASKRHSCILVYQYWLVTHSLFQSTVSIRHVNSKSQAVALIRLFIESSHGPEGVIKVVWGQFISLIAQKQQGLRLLRLRPSHCLICSPTAFKSDANLNDTDGNLGSLSGD